MFNPSTARLDMASNVGRGGYSRGGSNVVPVRNDSSTDTLVAMLASCSPVALQVQRTGGSLEDAVVSCGQKRSFFPLFEASREDAGDEDLGDDCTHNVEKKRRLTFDQVRSLELNFEVENKLEPERKMQLAKELGLQPRQVAVWFQNRRARWKTKQLERDYEVLTLDYNRLKSEFEAVLQEKQELQGEMECLTGRLQTSPQLASGDGVSEKPSKKSSKAVASQLSLQKMVSEECVKLESKPQDPNDSSNDDKEEGSRATSSDSISSGILDADSPLTTEMITTTTLPHISIHVAAEMPLSSNIINMSDNLCNQMLSPHACQQISVKLEDGSSQDESSSNYILTQLDEERGLPWWDWP